MRPFRPIRRPLWIGPVAAILLAAACSSADQSVTTDSSLPSTTVATGMQSESPDPVATVDPATASTVVQPEATTTTTTTTTTVPMLPEDRPTDPIFDPILDDLRSLSGVPVRLPDDADVDDDSELAATLSNVDLDGYLIHIGVGPDCNGGNVCRVSTFSGFVIDEDEPEDPAVGLEVPLPGGLTGRFFDATCGANCGDGTIVWVENGVRYSVGEKLAPGPDMVELAWASIEPDATPPARPTECGEDTVRDNGRVAVVHEDTDAGMYWLTTCSADGLRLALVNGPGELTWFDIDSDGEKDLALTLADGSTMLFAVAGIDVQPLMDFDTFSRLRIGDLRCIDQNGDGSTRFVDASEGVVFDAINPASFVRGNPVDDADGLDRCF